MKRGSAMLGTLVTVAIICVLLVVFMKGGCGSMLSAQSPRADGKGKTIPGLVKAKAQDDVCLSQLGQVRSFIMMAESDNDDKPPTSLSEAHVPDSLIHCPIGGETYLYDPATGKVKCPHPGHGKF
jgi:hypothetical protein